MTSFTKFSIAITAILFLNNNLWAQSPDGCNIFLQGNYLEIGVNWNGAYGSSSTPPVGYHPDTLSSFYNCSAALTTDTALGFVADVDKDGWNTGTPKYYGDYILPGTHQEGWSLLANGVQVNEWNYLAGDSSILEGGMTNGGTPPQYLSSTYLDSTDPSASTASLTFLDQLFLQVNQFTVLDTSKLFFTTYVFITNTGGTYDNVYYMRTIKPECDALLPGGGYTTRNKIEYASPTTNIVSATSPAHPKAYIALGTASSNASCFLIKNNAAPVINTIDNIAAGIDTNYLYVQNDTLTGDGGMGIIFNLGTVDPTLNPDSFSFVYAFTPQALSQALGVPYDTASSLTTNNIVPTPNYMVYPNPCKTSFSIANLDHTDHVQLYDELGRNVSKNLINTAYNTFSTGELPIGLYILLVENHDGTVKWKAPIQKQ